MEFKLTIEKKHLYVLTLLIAAVALVFAQGGGVSHEMSQITGLDAKLENYC